MTLVKSAEACEIYPDMYIEWCLNELKEGKKGEELLPWSEACQSFLALKITGTFFIIAHPISSHVRSMYIESRKLSVNSEAGTVLRSEAPSPSQSSPTEPGNS